MAKKTGDGPRVAIVGVTGAVGMEFLKVLQERDFPYASMKMLASARSAGKKCSFDGEVRGRAAVHEGRIDTAR